MNNVLHILQLKGIIQIYVRRASGYFNQVTIKTSIELVISFDTAYVLCCTYLTFGMGVTFYMRGFVCQHFL